MELVFAWLRPDALQSRSDDIAYAKRTCREKGDYRWTCAEEGERYQVALREVPAQDFVDDETFGSVAVRTDSEGKAVFYPDEAFRRKWAKHVVAQRGGGVLVTARIVDAECYEPFWLVIPEPAGEG